MKPLYFILWLLLLILLPFAGLHAQGGVGVNNSGAAADSSAILDVSSNTQGMLVPRMTEAERNAISNPVEALLIFNTTTKCFNFFKNGAWYEWCGNCIGAPTPLAGSNTPLCSGDTLELTASFIAGATYSWTGPNGFSSAQQNPVLPNVTTAAGGVYNVVATVGGCNSSIATTTVTVNALPLSSFNFLPAAPAPAQNVTFTPVVSGAVYNWLFQNGNPASSSIENPVVQWSAAGTYDVTLTVTQNGCSSSTTVQVTVSSSTPGTQTFNFTGAMQTFTVPAGISQVNIECYGAQGTDGEQAVYGGYPGNPGTLGGTGGLGGKASGDLTVTPGQLLYVYVGGQGGWNGGGAAGGGYGAAGGAGGGASDVRVGGMSLSDRVIVAGGGGGGGAGAENQLCSPGSPTDGGAGSGGGSGLNGGTGSCPNGPGPGVGGYANGSGGSGGSGSYSGSAGTNGTTGQGGAGGSTTYPHPPYDTGCTGAGGGGGGGYNGGGAGGGSGFNGGCGAPGGGGAGGSSYTGGVTNPSTQAGVQSGNGTVVFNW